MKVLISGAGGQLGRALMRTAPAHVQGVFLDRAGLDILDAAAVQRCIDEIRPSVFINAAAYTAVDKAEAEPERAFAINESAVGFIARACSAASVKLVHVSTDFVFDGTAGRPYRPDDPVNPLNVYGASKLAGERAVQETGKLDWRIIRTAWVYDSTGRNFVLTMLRLFGEREVLRVVADQIGTPTSANSLAECVWCAAQGECAASVMHFTDAGVASWYDFAVAIYEEGRTLGLVARDVDIVPIATEEYPTPARRPPYSVLDKRSTLSRLNLVPVHWRANLRNVLRELQG